MRCDVGWVWHRSPSGGGAILLPRYTRLRACSLLRADASLASRVMASQSLAATALAGVSHEPPTHTTLGRARNSGAVAAVIPPVGQNCTSGNGPDRALSIPIPPAC